MTDNDPAELLCCARCVRLRHEVAGTFYRVTIEAVAEPTFSAEEEEIDLREEIERVLAQLEDVSVPEAQDQVCCRRILYLCGPCYRRWIDNPTG
jgi:hypothetical protein